jgi:hypothetical protein
LLLEGVGKRPGAEISGEQVWFEEHQYSSLVVFVRVFKRSGGEGAVSNAGFEDLGDVLSESERNFCDLG